MANFQLIYREGKTLISRTPLAVNGNSLIFAAPLNVGQKVQFGFANAFSVLSGSNLIAKKISSELEYDIDTAYSLSEAKLFLHPQNKPVRVNHLLTNFHLPKSTLLMLVASFGSYPLIISYKIEASSTF